MASDCSYTLKDLLKELSPEELDKQIAHWKYTALRRRIRKAYKPTNPLVGKHINVLLDIEFI